MKVPKYIEASIIKAGRATKVNRDNSEVVRKWLEREGLINEESENLTEDDVINFMIDCIENGVDGSTALINYLNNL